ncbi:hypothetical protein D932_01293 [Enterococcus casseliflavus 14-MB-W-14]|nr:hypothetical protein D932_01293 [Enterococcus casseliflavus 14-MB-W-14]
MKSTRERFLTKQRGCWRSQRLVRKGLSIDQTFLIGFFVKK